MIEKVLEMLDDVVYDICEVYEKEDVAKMVATFANKLDRYHRHEEYKLGKHKFKVSNTIRGFVSCSNIEDGNTSVSNTLYIPFYCETNEETEEVECEDGLRNLIEMINEAWYACESE